MTLLLLRLVVRRILFAVPMVFAVVALTFFLIHLAPGDPALILAGEAPTPAFLEAVRAEYGLDKPLYQQFIAFAGKAVTGDFGQSLYYNQPVISVILDRVPASALLTLSALGIAAVIGVVMGVAAARRAGSRADAMISMIAMAGYSIPGFWIGQFLVLIFAVQLNLLPSGGMGAVGICFVSVWAALKDLAAHMVLPVMTQVIFLVTLTARFTRTAMIEALDQDFVTVARAKGAGPGRVVWHHAFRNAIAITITVIGLEFGAIIAGSLVIETVFSWPGLGRLFYDAIFRRDFPLLTGLLLFIATLVVLINVLTDVLCAAIDPRLRK